LHVSYRFSEQQKRALESTANEQTLQK